MIKPDSAPLFGIIDPTEGLQALYCIRSGFSILWVILVLTFAQTDTLEKILLVLYPAWDVVCTFIDIRVSGNAKVASAQYLNCMFSVVTTTLIAFALQEGVPATMILFGFWAMLTGLIQLITALKRKPGFSGQWPMIISGVQSMLAGSSFITLSHVPGMGVGSLAAYAAFGAFYYVLSAIRLRK